MQRSWTLARSTLALVLVVSLTIGMVPVAAAATPQSPVAPAHSPDRGLTGGDAPSAAPSLDGVGAPDTFAQTTTNNSSDRHRNPSTVDDEETLDELQRDLARRLADRHQRSSVLISQGEYEAARAVFDEEYRSLLDKYVEVADARNDDVAEETAADFRTASRSQAQYAQTVGEFAETHEAYLDARSSGNETRTRELARRVDRLGGWAAENATQLQANYTRLTNETAANFTGTSDRVRTIQESVTERRAQASQSTFVRTSLTFVEADPGGSFVEPMRIRLRLESQGTPVANRPITVEVGQQSMASETDADGEFVVTYRPRLLARNATTVNAQYVPQETSAYLGSSATVPITVTGVTGTIEVSDSTAEAGFGDPVNVSGRVVVGDRVVPDVPLNVTVRGRTLDQVRTDDNGTFALSTTLPLNVTEGPTSLAVRFAVDGRAVTAAPAVRPLEVAETEPDLTVSTLRREDVVRLSGQLTADGTPVEDQQVRVTRDGQTVATVRTGTNGTFLVELADIERDATAVVTFDGGGTNLATVSAEATLPGPDPTVPTATAETEPNRLVPSATVELVTSFVLSQLNVVLGGLLFVVAAVGLVFAYRRATGQPTVARTQPSGSATEVTSSPTVSPSQTLEAAADSLDAGDIDAAVLGAYAAVRQTLRATVSVDHPYTHRQFVDAGLAAGVDRDPLQTLTNTYEAVQYGQQPVSGEDAAAAVAAARSLVGAVRSDADN